MQEKTDKIDAKILADLLRTNYLSEIWIPDEQILQIRNLTGYKADLPRLRTQIRGKI